ncbi:polyhydroxyalkanoate synthesis repressor PhaR [Asticcacaulis benevestitus]|uniref:Polyhydroxyalkanoate synthesis repressor PhaR n=1 Tax=Asticcacaulis benevestitus DSM 16100 = ATCC BAA-896 TaxID=1121022 RepID=V4PEK0_9CAUL|nr:polyhydroxyalkanoate synthesis repressor PhaR [Asticcacaulis benevestitus]ESQ85559.1 polyhydroxyalkanoate synthesis repressor PhaR [Asticcacaulis benevestitus DSM 16100 = ATCC BAA-896]
MAETKTRAKRGEGDRVIIKKYANRRLYNTATSSYVTLDNLSDMVRQGVDFVVYDAKSGDDITRTVLAQIIFEEESHGQNLLPIQFLRQLISFYGDSMQNLLPTYLEMSLDGFAKQQERFRSQFSTAFGGTPGLGFFDEQVSQNLAMFDRAMRMFSPFSFANTAGQTGAATPDYAAPSESAPAAKPETDQVRELRQQMEAMKAQIDQLASKG